MAKLKYDLELSYPQNVYLNQLTTKFRGYIGGFGSGKTFIGALDLFLFALKHPKIVQGYFGPTYTHIKDIFWPVCDEIAELLGLDVDIKKADKEVWIYKTGRLIGVIICRSMDNPNAIVGFKIARGMVDEIDTLPLDKSKKAWIKIIARLRLVLPGVMNSIGVTCTPEGFLFAYKKFKKDPTASYSMVQASTYENEEYLPEDYIPSLLESYPANLVQAYVGGQFVNLQSGSVYSSFDREKNNRKWVIHPGPIEMGNDFNVLHTCGIMAQMIDGVLHVYGEYIDCLDSPTLVKSIKSDFGSALPHINSYPDASGKSRSSSNASISDHAVISEIATIRTKPSNPAIKDRTMSVNKAFEMGLLTIDVDACPVITEALEQQAYDRNGLPDKSQGFDHPCDALGYMVYWHFPIIKPSSVSVANKPSGSFSHVQNQLISGVSFP